MRIALDVMGGDHVPGIPIKGAIEAIGELENDFDLILVGNKELIERHLEKYREFVLVL